MKKIYLFIACLAVAVMGCNNDLETEGISRTTYFPEFVYEGAQFNVIEESVDYSDPGITVLEQGSEIAFTQVTTGRYTGFTGTTSVGTEPDEYRMTYSAINKDGFPGTSTRTIAKVNTGDYVSSVSGAYAGTSVRITDEAYEDVLILVIETEPGVFTITDALAGFYSDGRALGDDYLTVGLEITPIDLPNGDFEYEDTVVRLADGAEMTISDMVIDTDAHTISYHVSAPDFASGDWDVTLTQIQP